MWSWHPKSGPFQADSRASGLLRAHQDNPGSSRVKEGEWFCFIVVARLIFLIFGSHHASFRIVS